MSLFQQFISFNGKENLFSSKDKLLLAVSGGVDSVVLCELCRRGGYEFVLAHCNFTLRGDESERDEKFVEQLALRYGVPFLLKTFDTNAYAAAKKLSIQEAARELRYNWFSELVQSGQAAWILTAHHLDDNIETMLMHFFRGTGIHGLRGMVPKQGKIVRPLLFARKSAIKQFAIEQQLPWAEDTSNSEDKYTRNYFRHQVLPLVQQAYPAAEQNLVHNLHRFAEVEILYQQALDQQKKRLLEQKGSEIHIPVLKLKKAIPLHTIVYEIIRNFGFSPAQTGEVIALLDSESGKYVQSAGYRIIKNRNWLIIAGQSSKQSQHIVVEEKDSQVEFEKGLLQIKTFRVANFQVPNAPATACLDSAAIIFPLLLRKWKNGDYFYPLGMRKKKKLARFFIDQKLSLADKEKVWVLESNKKIIWVVGMRIDDRFKITPTTQQVLTIDLILT